MSILLKLVKERVSEKPIMKFVYAVKQTGDRPIPHCKPTSGDIEIV